MEDDQSDSVFEGDPAKVAVRPSRKRTKMSEDQGIGDSLQVDEEEASTTSRVPSFTIFSGPSEPSDHYVDPPPPNNPLPDLFPASTSGAGPSYPRQGSTATANASENRQPFNFSFPSMSSTPAHGLFMPSFPYPEPPQSPSPPSTNPTAFLNTLRDRTDIFQSFGLPPQGPRSRVAGSRLGSGVGGGFVNPAALTGRIVDRVPEEAATSSSVVPGDEMTTGQPEPGQGLIESVADVPLMKRTMYGTELDGDTRFGDFGVEGVGSNGGFWAGGRY